MNSCLICVVMPLSRLMSQSSRTESSRPFSRDGRPSSSFSSSSSPPTLGNNMQNDLNSSCPATHFPGVKLPLMGVPQALSATPPGNAYSKRTNSFVQNGTHSPQISRPITPRYAASSRGGEAHKVQIFNLNECNDPRWKDSGEDANEDKMKALQRTFSDTEQVKV